MRAGDGRRDGEAAFAKGDVGIYVGMGERCISCCRDSCCIPVTMEISLPFPPREVPLASGALDTASEDIEDCVVRNLSLRFRCFRTCMKGLRLGIPLRFVIVLLPDDPGL